ncbi:antitoxin Xre/MbcA/ParS toxin-binding domain-containing protein [Aquabacterium sp.]|uniref:antitoxin Xre/MbcA/ParS toxin-binding domain-containing protein n=1 Tax=Aquabacterium sp. TaxID=1872578 RepID=UPI0040384E4D
MAAVSSKTQSTAKRTSGKSVKAVASTGLSQSTRGRKSVPVHYGSQPSTALLPAAGVKLVYKRSQGVDAYLKQVHEATPVQMVEMERLGVAGTFITDLSKRMELPSSRVFAMLRIPPATAARKAASGAVVDGRAGLAAIGMIKLLGIAQDIVEDSTALEAQDFDTVKWLGQWIERPQPALGGKKPADYLDTPSGVEMVAQLLGAMRSGAYL